MLEIIQALFSAAGKVLAFWQGFRQFRGCGREIEKNPMYPGAYRRVRVVGDQGKALNPRGRAAPFERGRNVRTVTGVFGRDGFAFGKRGAGKLHKTFLRVLGDNTGVLRDLQE